MQYFVCLLLFCLFNGLPLYAQQAPFEQQMVVLADGTEKLLWISLDVKSELLHYKFREEQGAAVYQAADVVSFRFGGQQFYTLPLREGYYTFFTVHHEGNEFAVLEKIPNYKSLRIIADESGGHIAMCQNRNSNEFYLCFKDNRYNSGMKAQFYSSNAIREFEVHKLIYLVVEGRLNLFYMETDERFSFWDDWMGPRPGKRRTERMLEDFIKDPQKLALIQQKVKHDKLDIRDTKQLILALEAVYR